MYARASRPHDLYWCDRSTETRPEVRCFEGDITREQDVLAAMAGVQCVFHMASFGMSGLEQVRASAARAEASLAATGLVESTQIASPDYIYEVNVRGTENVVRACLQLGVPRLVRARAVSLNEPSSVPLVCAPLGVHVDVQRGVWRLRARAHRQRRREPTIPAA